MEPFALDILASTLAEPSRRALLESLRGGRKSVTELVEATGLKQPNVSNHLSKMRREGLVDAERIGRQVYYALAPPVAEMLLRLEEIAGRPLTGSLLASALVQPDRTVPIAAVAAPSEALLAAWRDTYLRAVLTGREDRAAALVNVMLARRIALETIYVDIFGPALIRIGDLYAQGETDVAHEHIASALTERMMAGVAQFYSSESKIGRCAVLGCVAENRHVLGLRMLADGLAHQGWKTLFAGANVPTACFAALVSAEHPDLVAVSCSLESQMPETRRLVQRLDAYRCREPRAAFRIAVGGHFPRENPEALSGLPVDFTSRDLRQFLVDVKARFPA